MSLNAESEIILYNTGTIVNKTEPARPHLRGTTQ